VSYHFGGQLKNQTKQINKSLKYHYGEKVTYPISHQKVDTLAICVIQDEIPKSRDILRAGNISISIDSTLTW
jgi:hypothetical protein